MRLLWIWSVILLFGAQFAHAEYPKPALEAYGALPQVSVAEISPDGTKIAAIANFDDETRLIILNVGGGVLTQLGIGEMKARNVSFYDNDHVVIRVSKTRSIYGYRGEGEFGAAFAFEIKTGKVTQLLKRARDLYPGQFGLGEIVGLGEKEGEVLMPAFTGESSSSTPSYDLMRATLGETTAWRASNGSHETIDWFVGDNGKALARETYNNRSNVYRVRAHVDGAWRDVYENVDERLPMSIWGVMPDESGLIFVRVRYNDKIAGNDELMKMGFDGAISGPITPPRDREIDALVTDKNRKLLGVKYAGIEPEYVFLDEKLQDSYDKVKAALPYATINLSSWSDDRETLLYHVFDVALGDVWLTHKRSTNAMDVAANLRPDIPPAAMGQMYSVEYKSLDGLTIQSIITTPPDYDSTQAVLYPAIILPHGGPAAYDRFDFDWMAQYFANRGYIVVQPNFRGSTGFGWEFQNAGRGEWGGKMQEDITAGVDALAKAKMIDRDRVCIVGASYGGYAALAGAVFTPDLYKCVIAIAPVSDLNRMLEEAKDDYGSNHWVIDYWEDIMVDGDARRSKLDSISPVKFARNVTAPVLLLHGDDDLVVSISQSRVMKNALERADKQVEFVTLKGEDHWLSVADTRMQTLQAMDAFIAEHLPAE